MSQEYLTEDGLKDFFKQRSKFSFVHNKGLVSLKSRIRPDFYFPDLKIVVEFDGPQHYTSASIVLGDQEKAHFYTTHRIKCIRIPYFLQLDTNTITNLLKDLVSDISPFLMYPHGFISTKTVLPADFCELGIERFTQDLKTFHWAAKDIIQSLSNKINLLGNTLKVVPKSLLFLLDNAL